MKLNDRSRMKRSTSLLATSIILGAISIAHGDVIFSDNFNAENGGVANDSTLNYTSFANFDVAGQVDLIGNGYYDFYPGNGLYVDLTGSPDTGSLTTKNDLNFVAGTKYVVSLDLGNNPGSLGNGGPDSVEVAVTIGAGSFSLTHTFAPGSALLTNYSFSFIAPVTVSSKLKIAETDGSNDGQGVIVDNVQVAAVPLPPAALAGAGLFSAMGVYRRWKRSRV